MQDLCLRLGGRPRIIFAPNIRSSFEYVCLWQARPFPFQIIFKEGELDIRAEKLTCLGAKLHVAEVIAIGDRPAAMHPGAHDQRICESGVELIDGMERLERP